MQEKIDGFSRESWLNIFDWVNQQPQEYVEAYLNPQQHHQRKVPADLFRHIVGLTPKVSRKFLNPSRWVWSSRHLELSSNQLTAELVASYFPLGEQIRDIGCGGGADALALAGRGPVIAIDRDEFAVRLTAANHKLQRETLPYSFQAQVGEAESLNLTPESFVHLDPDRRQLDRRSVSLQWHSPTKECIQKLVASSAGGSMKLAPACHDSPSFLNRPISKHWISFQQSVVQQRWWWGIQSLEDSRCFVSAYSSESGWVHASPSFDQFILDESRVFHATAEVSVGSYIGDGDPVLRAAGCQMGYVEGHDCWLLGSLNGYYIASSPIWELPLIRWRKVMEILPLRAKDLRNFMRLHDFEGIELKTRNIGPISPDIQRLASASGSKRCFVYATKVGTAACAIIACDI